MKKKLSLFSAILVSGYMFGASLTPTAKLKVLINSQSSISGDNIMMVEAASLSPQKDNGYDGTKNIIAGNLQMWAVASFGNLATIGTNKLDSIPITVQTINDDEYTFSFSNVDGRELNFIDLLLDSVMVISNSTVYKCVLDKNSTIQNRFYVGVYAAPDYEVCFRYGKLQFTGYKNGQVIIKDSNGTEVLKTTISKNIEEIDLTDRTTYPAGHYTVEANGKTLTIRVK